MLLINALLVQLYRQLEQMKDLITNLGTFYLQETKEEPNNIESASG